MPPKLAIPASNVSRVRREAFSKNITICLPASALWKTDGRDFISSARWSTASTPRGPKSRVETRSGRQKTSGKVAGATGVRFCHCRLVFNLDSSFLDFGNYRTADAENGLTARSCARHLRPAGQLRKVEFRQNFRLRSGQDSHPPNSLLQGLPARLQLGQHSSADDRVRCKVIRLLCAQPGNDRSFGVLHAGHVGKKNESVRVTSRSTGCGHFVRIYVVVLTVGTQRQ